MTFNARKKRFLKAYFNLCLDHGFAINGLGVENWGQVEEIDTNCSRLSLLYSCNDDRICINTYDDLEPGRQCLESEGKHVFMWLQEI